MEWALLAAVPGDDVQRLLQIARRRTFRRGEVVFHMGDPADGIGLGAGELLDVHAAREGDRPRDRAEREQETAAGAVHG